MTPTHPAIGAPIGVDDGHPLGRVDVVLQADGRAMVSWLEQAENGAELLESLGPALILTGYDIPSPFQLKNAFTFLVLVLVLIFRPGGILGTGEAEKV